MSSILVTGSNRGLGLEWVRQYGAAGWRVYATCRHPEESGSLQQLAGAHDNISVHRLDVTKQDEIMGVVSELADEPLDILMSNAGVYFEKRMPDAIGSLRYADWNYAFQVNTMATLRLTEAFVENVARSSNRLIVAISTHMACIADIKSAGSYYYRSTKAALNAAMKGLSVELKPRGIGVLMLHPGWVRTRMGGPEGPLVSADSVQAMRAIIEDFSLEDTGRFLSYKGHELPW